MQKYTKIIATIGPSTFQPEMLERLQKAGMNAARINMSHGDYETQALYIKNIRTLDENFPILIDTKGPEVRIGIIPDSPLHLAGGSVMRLVNAKVQDAPDVIPVDYPHLDEIKVGTQILFDDGLVESEVIENSTDGLKIKIVNEGPVSTSKKVTIQEYQLRLPFLTERDKEDILFAIEQNVSLIAASFVRSAEDILELKAFLAEHNAKMMIFAKIEQGEAVEDLDRILKYSDGIMVARGDLGVELPLQEVPAVQEKIIRKCNIAGKPVIVATQMLESMRENPRPTRAEVNDIAHAILQGADAIMLSAETATGKYPVRSVEMMYTIALEYEKRTKSVVKKHKKTHEGSRAQIALYIAEAAFYASEELEARAILTPTESGFTARNVSRFRPKCSILASTKDPLVVQFLNLVWGVIPMLDTDGFLDMPHYDMSRNLILKYYRDGLLSEEDNIIITSGSNLLTKRGTNLLEIYAVKEIIASDISRESGSSAED